MRSRPCRGWVWITVIWIQLLCSVAAADYSLTTKHEAGRCAIRGHCGKVGFFGSDLPCADNGLAESPDDTLRKAIVDVCGDKWQKGPVCCNAEQVDALKTNLDRAQGIISSCAACKENFFNLFCSFTCSPDQSLFVNVTKVQEKEEKLLVEELDNLWSDQYGSGFYDSCKDVKFGPTNSKAMSFIGGGATNYTAFLKFLGDKKLLGSPFQINFPRPSEGSFPGMKPLATDAIPCNTTDPQFKCACVDCDGSCPKLPEVQQTHECHVGAWPCFSFAVVIIYVILLSILLLAIAGYVAYQKHSRSKNERLRLLQDTSLSDDERDEGDDEIIYQRGTFAGRPIRKYFLNTLLDRAFSRLGRACAGYPAITIASTALVCALLCLGWLRFEVETDPVRLWVPPDSNAAQEKAFFDDNFGPFFRAEQAFVVNDTHPDGPQPVLSFDTVKWWVDVERRVRRVKSLNNGITFEDVCYKPQGDACVVQSVTAYFGGPQEDVPHSWQARLEECAKDPSQCRAESGQPIPPKMLFGGYNQSVLESKALITTWVVQNYQEGSERLKQAMDWEKSMEGLLLDVQVEARERGLRLSFNTEISLEQELNKSTNTDAKIIVVSYVIMFIYASIALGSSTFVAGSLLRNPSAALVQSKFMLGIVGIVIVLLSVATSVGLFSALGIKVTLIIAEVIPFLVLAIGVDNIFLITHELETFNASHPDEMVEDRMGRAIGRIGPSIVLSAAMETVAFALGTVVGMPAVRNFAAYAAGAVLINAILQVTMFVSFLALNQRRVEDRRIDCVPCIRLGLSSTYDRGSNYTFATGDDALQRFIQMSYAPRLLGKKAKILITTIFLGLFTIGLALLPSIDLGLDQRIAIPDGSYLIDYYNDLYAYFNAGPPVYFVTREFNATERTHQQELCGRFTACDVYSLSAIVEQESKRPNVSYIADTVASWLDDYFIWLSDPKCCVDPKTNKQCDPPWSKILTEMPEGTQFMDYLRIWLEAPSNEHCYHGGKAAYGNALVIPNASDSNTKPDILASHFRTSHTPLHSQHDFIESYAAARRVASEIMENNPGLEVFPYSKHYVFFDQYATIIGLTSSLLASAVGVCFIISALLLGSIRTGIVVAITVVMILVDIIGAMVVMGVSLNALTLVNLVICVGIAVEFCAHIARAFQFPSQRLLDRSSSVSDFVGRNLGALTAASGVGVQGSRHGSTSAPPQSKANAGPAMSFSFKGRDARAWAAMAQVGSSVFSGITITKFLGVCVLAFTRSKIFDIYYFRVWVALVIFAALHALVWLPVALSWGGDRQGWLEDDSSTGGVEEDLRRRRGLVGRYRDSAIDDDDDDLLVR